MRLRHLLPTLSVLLLFAGCQTHYEGGGIPYDTKSGRLLEKCIKVRLTENQKQEYQEFKSVTLTDQQYSRFTKSCPTFPQKIEEILRYTYNDCTCCVDHPYAIILPGESVIAVPMSELAFVAKYGPRKFIPPSFSESAAPPPAATPPQ